MLYKYNCLLTPRLYGRICIESAPLDVQLYRKNRVLDKWFYFYINDPVEPIIIWSMRNFRADGRDTGFHIEPGLNRYTGIALRKSKIQIPGRLITDYDIDDSKIKIPREIEILDVVDSVDLPPLLHDYCPTFDKNGPREAWAIDGETNLNDNAWHIPVYKWIEDNLEHTWGLEYKDKLHYVNYVNGGHTTRAETANIVSVKDFRSLSDAVSELFAQISREENFDSR